MSTQAMEVKVYHSLWKQLLVVALCLVFVIGGAFMQGVVGWLSIIFFGGGGAVLLYANVLRERMGRKPYLTITDKGVVISQVRSWEVRFADVERFDLLSNGKNTMIGIYYRKGVRPKSGAVSRALQRLNMAIAAGAQDGIPADGLSISPEELLGLLNERSAPA